MSIWSKVLVVLTFFASVGFFYLSLRTLKTNQNWRTLVKGLEKQLADVEQGNQATLSLEALAAEVREQTVALDDVLVDRGRVWYDAVPKVDAAKGLAVVQIESPAPHGIIEKTVLYVFDARAGSEGGAYLGEFKVTGVDDKAKQAQLEPTMKLSPRQARQLAESKGHWTLYEIMPGDRRGMFAGLAPAELAGQLPEDSQKEYVKDGQPAANDDPPDRVVDGKYQRELRDYAGLFHELDRQLSVLRDEQAAAQKDLDSVLAAWDDAKKHVEFTAAQIKELKEELERSNGERNVVTSYREAVGQSLAAVQAEVEKTLAQNKRIAARWAVLQTQAAARIDRESAVATP